MLFQLSQPSDDQVRQFLAAQAPLPFSYREVGASRAAIPPGYPVNHYRAHLGTGSSVYQRAVEALQHWRMYDLPWIRFYWPATPLQIGEVVAVAARHFGFWSLNACRIIYVIEEHGPLECAGFGYGTLPGHVEQGEERFLVIWHRDSDVVWYELIAFARPRHPLAKVGYPVARLLQKRFARDSARAMQKAIAHKTR